MNKLIPILFLLTLGVVSFSSCDDTPGNTFDAGSPRVLAMSLSPNVVDFVPADGVKDTIITITIQANVEGLSTDSLPRFVVFDRENSNEPELTGTLAQTPAQNQYEGTFELSVNTLDFNRFDVFVFSFGDLVTGNWVSSSVAIDGFPNARPQILEANNVSEVVIPTDGSTTPVRFTARITDADGQNTIDRVAIIFRNEDGSILTPNPNQLFDDGAAASGDVAAGDSVFTITFSIDGSNTPSNRTALYFAIDNAGLSSDTVTTTFNIVSN